MKKHWLLFYDVVPDYLERRAPYREEHLALAREAVARGELILGGAFGAQERGAVLLFECETPEPIVAFAEADPYVRNGVVRTWEALEWTTVVGPMATTDPIAPPPDMPSILD